VFLFCAGSIPCRHETRRILHWGDDKNIMIRYWNNLSRQKDATAAKEYFDLFKSWVKEKETRYPFLEWIDQYLAGDWLFAFTDMFRENNYGIQNTNNYSLMTTKIVNRLHDYRSKEFYVGLCNPGQKPS